MNHPTHRERAEQLLQRAATQLETMSDTDEEFPAFAGVIGTGFAVLAHLDALELPAPGTGDEILAAARKLTDELELDNPVDHGQLTWGSDDHVQGVVAGAPVAPVATNAPSPVSPNAGNGSGELRADLALVVSPAVVGFTDVEREPVPEAGGYALTLTSAGLLTDAVVEALLAAGWRPPLPNGGQNLAENAGRVMVKRLLAHRWPGGDWANSSLSHIAEVALAGVMPFLDEPPAARVVEEAGRG